MCAGLRELAGVVALSLLMTLPEAPATADGFVASSFACRHLLTGTYLTTVESDGVFASRSVITLHRDGTVAVVDARESSGVTDTAFSAQQGSYRCIGRTSAVATTLDFGFPPDQNIGRFDWRIGLTREHTIEGEITLTLLTPLESCNPFDADATCDPSPRRFDFTFTSVRVPAQAE